VTLKAGQINSNQRRIKIVKMLLKTMTMMMILGQIVISTGRMHAKEKRVPSED
jgi:hypothetical protein